MGPFDERKIYKKKQTKVYYHAYLTNLQETPREWVIPQELALGFTPHW